MGKYFGTDGFRGEANVNLTVEHAYKVGRFLGWYYGQDHKAQVVIGKDTRRSSYMFEYSLVAGLTASGADVYLLHVTTTPSVSYVVRTEGFDCGIMISASHNPFYDNGIKIINGSGYKLEAEVEQKIEDYIDGKTEEIPFATRENIGRTVDFAAGRNRYIGYLISLPTRSFKTMRVGLDCSNGSASAIAKSVFDALGAKTYVIHNEPDGTNINKDCGSTHIESLQAFVKEKGLDVGFAYDGDADRCLAVDEHGNVVDGDLILYVCGKYLKEIGQLKDDMIVTTVLSNIGLKKEIDIQSSVWFWSKLTNIRCSGLRMVVGHCEECTFWSVILDDTVMAGFRFVKSVILGCQFTDTTLSNLRLKKCEVSHLKLSNVMLTDVVFDRCIFKELDLEHITFEKVKFKNCYFDKLPETIPEGCKFKHCMEIPE